jgi:carboxypeptidase C (cathepsin A)
MSTGRATSSGLVSTSCSCLRTPLTADTGAAGYAEAEWRDWSVGEDEAAGQTKSFGPLTFVTVLKAGHMVPYDKPAESLAMVRRWLAEEDM